MSHMRKGSCVHSWTSPHLVLPLSVSAVAPTKSDLATEQLPKYQPCDVLSFLRSRHQHLLSIETKQGDSNIRNDDNRNKWKNFIRKLRRDGSSSAHCMLATLEIILANEHGNSTALQSDIVEKRRRLTHLFVSDTKELSCQLPEDINMAEDDVADECLQEGWTLVQDWISLAECCRLYRQVANHMYLITLPHPLLRYARQTLFKLSTYSFSK